jgi:hypothetical protein
MGGHGHCDEVASSGLDRWHVRFKPGTPPRRGAGDRPAPATGRHDRSSIPQAHVSFLALCAASLTEPPTTAARKSLY